MRARVLVATLVALAAVAYFFRAVGGSGDSEPPAARPDVVRGDRYAPPSPPPSVPLRDVFQYGDAVRPAGERPAPGGAPIAAPPAPAPLPEPSPMVRLVGLLRRGGTTRAALAIAGDTVVLGTGESAEGYTVESIEEDEVRLRAPDGGTLVLTPRSE